MQTSSIHIDVTLDNDKIPHTINWSAQSSTAENAQAAKAMILSFWDGADKSALRIDLWTKDMMVDEMADFCYQHISGMADMFQRATGKEGLSNDLRIFAKAFLAKFREQQEKEAGLS